MTSNTALNWGIHLLDTGFHRDNMAACYVVEDEGGKGAGKNSEVAIIETGTKDTVPVIEAFLHDQISILHRLNTSLLPTYTLIMRVGRDCLCRCCPMRSLSCMRKARGT